MSLCVECGTTETVEINRSLWTRHKPTCSYYARNLRDLTRAREEAKPQPVGVELWRCPECGAMRTPAPDARLGVCTQYGDHPDWAPERMEKVRVFTLADIEAKLPMLERLLKDDPEKATVWALPLLLLGNDPFPS